MPRPVQEEDPETATHCSGDRWCRKWSDSARSGATTFDTGVSVGIVTVTGGGAPPVALLQECLMQTHKQTKLIEQTIPEKLGGRKPRPALAPLKLGLKVATHTFYL